MRFLVILNFFLSVLSFNYGFAQQKPVSRAIQKPVTKATPKVSVKPAYTPPYDTTICIKANFFTDTVKHFSIDKCQTRYNNKDGITGRLCTRYEISLKVEECRTNAYLVLWHYDKIIPGEGFDKETPFRNAIETLLQGVKVEFLLDTLGNFIKTDYWFTTADQLTAKVDSLKARFANDTLTKPYINKLYKLVNNMDAIEPTISQLGELYFSCYGKYITQKSGTRTSCRFPNIFAGEPFQASGRVRIDTFDRKSKKLTLNWHQGIDTTEAFGIIKKTLVKQAQINGHSIPKDENIPHINIFEDYHLRFNMRSTWFTRIEYTKITSNGKAGERDNIIIRLHK